MIEKNYMRGGVNIKILIDDGVAIMTTTNPHVTFQMFQFSRKSGKDVSYNYSKGIVKEIFKNKTAEEIAEMIEKDAEESTRMESESKKFKLK